MFARSAARLANLRLTCALQRLRSLTLSPRTAASQAVSLREVVFFASLAGRGAGLQQKKCLKPRSSPGKAAGGGETNPPRGKERGAGPRKHQWSIYGMETKPLLD